MAASTAEAAGPDAMATETEVAAEATLLAGAPATVDATSLPAQVVAAHTQASAAGQRSAGVSLTAEVVVGPKEAQSGGGAETLRLVQKEAADAATTAEVPTAAASSTGAVSAAVTAAAQGLGITPASVKGAGVAPVEAVPGVEPVVNPVAKQMPVAESKRKRLQPPAGKVARDPYAAKWELAEPTGVRVAASGVAALTATHQGKGASLFVVSVSIAHTAHATNRHKGLGKIVPDSSGRVLPSYLLSGQR